ncbi:MAG: ABC transporter ATP-binding protein [Patescibacteria group bacterium]
MRKKNSKAITINKISKEYVLHHQKPTFFGTIFGIEKRQKFFALKDVSLEIYKGEKIGVIGSNGSGKTTLLKIASGITTQSGGKIKTYGKVVSLIELGAGFHPELTGKENIFLNGLVIGMDKDEIQRKFESIVEFSGLGEFIYAPLYTYSSGMSLRLGFAIAIHSNPDVLILDEEIAVGDEKFRKKSMKKINEFSKHGKTIILVSHWLEYIRRNCNRIIWLEKGIIRGDGGEEVIDEYIEFLKKQGKYYYVI